MKRVSISSDLHGQCKNPSAFDVHLQIVKDFRPDIHIIVGDWLEFDAVSRHPRAHTKPPNLGFEYDVANKDLDLMDKVLPRTTKKVFIEGNHEYRLYRELCNQFPNLEGGIKTIPEALHLADRGWEWVPYGKSYYLSKHLIVRHGDYTNKYHAQKHVESFGNSIIYGHTHSYQVYSTTHGDSPHLGMSIGCLSTLEPDWQYGKPVPWVNGFAVVYLLDGGKFVTQFIPIIYGKTVFNGKPYSSRV